MVKLLDNLSIFKFVTFTKNIQFKKNMLFLYYSQ